MKKKQIIVSINGGLGNQMFQYAFGRTLADKRECDLTLDISSLNKNRYGVTKRNYVLDVFRIRANIHKDPVLHNRLKLFSIRKIPLLSNILKIRLENRRGYKQDFILDSRSRYFHGYWQSYLYFSSNAKEIYNDFNLEKPLSISALTLLNKIKASQAVMIHVRRGDYITSKLASSKIGVLNNDYYRLAINKIKDNVINPFFYIFSDDIEWCKKEFSYVKDSIYFIENSLEISDWEALIVMSHCKDLIIANSTFSWWAAWLADQRYGDDRRLVIAPVKWFKKQDLDLSEIYPNHWILI